MRIKITMISNFFKLIKDNQAKYSTEKEAFSQRIINGKSICKIVRKKNQNIIFT